MSQKRFFRAAVAALCMLIMLICSEPPAKVYAATGYNYVVLTQYSKTMQIGDEFYLIAVTSTGKTPTFSSSDKTVASVNTYGKVTAKKAGTATITAKITNGEASCKIKVTKTSITLSQTSISLENGYTARLTADVSTGHTPTYKSSKTSVASVDEDGLITANKPGEATITVTADKTSVTCKVKVKNPTVRLSKSSASLYRKGTVKLTVTKSSKSTPTWKSNKTSVATVDSDGTVTAIKNGTAIITVTVDGVSKTCEITVKKPTITFAKESVTLKEEATYQTNVTVSSGNTPEYTSSNVSVATVDENGLITAKSAGKATIYAKEDGTKVSMKVVVKSK
jgi:uncharacterized protein YjdB